MMKYWFCGLLLSWAILGHAQQDTVELSLDDCITTALDRNIQMKRARNDQLIAEANRFQAIMNFFPSVNGNVNYDFYFGTFFDQNAARQVTSTTNSSSPNINSTLVLFNGFQKHHNLKQRQNEAEASFHNVNDSRLQVESAILGSYLQVILDQENITISRQRVAFLQKQLEREEKRASVGVGNLESVYNFKSQLANERLNLTIAENQLKSDMLTLLQAMQQDPSEAIFKVMPYQVSDEELLVNVESFDEVLNDCLEVNPALKNARANQLAAKYQYKSVSAGRFPTLSVFGQWGSNYSSNGATNPSLPYRDPETGAEGFNFEPDATFREQMGYNEYEYVNFSLRLPIFNQLQTHTAAQIAKINVANAELTSVEALNSITNAVQQAYLDLMSAQSTYASAKENLEALNQTYDFMTVRFDTGNTDFYTYLESLNNKNRAELQLVNAKYSIIFRKKILDLYRGK